MINRLESMLTDSQLFKALVGILIFLSIWYVLTAVLNLPRFKLIPNPIAVIKEWVSFESISGRSLFTKEYYIDIGYSVVRTLVAFFLATF